MEIIRCPFCSFELAGDKQLIGRRVQCYRCREKFSVEESMFSEVENNTRMDMSVTPPPMKIDLALNSAPEEPEKLISRSEQQSVAVAESSAVKEFSEKSSSVTAKIAPVDCDDGINWVVNRILLGVAIFGAVVFIAAFTVRWCLRDSIDAAQKAQEKAGYEELENKMDKKNDSREAMIREDDK